MEIPGYKIEKLVAEGGMASVYLAIQESLDRRVALKVLRKFDTPAQSERFINEGRIIASLTHRNIITIHDIGAVEGRHYISMEYLKGGDLEKRIRAGIAPEDAIDLTRTLGLCLDFLHGQGIVHRDIKPANILFRDDENPILTDFGIAKHLHRDSSLTMDGTAMGCPDYLSPEQAECKSLDGRADIYSLGIVLYEMLTGEKPYKGDSYIEIVMAHITAPIPDLPRHLKRYQELVDRMIAKDPADRFATAADLVAHLDVIENGQTTESVSERIAGFVSSLRKPVPPKLGTAATVELAPGELQSATATAEGVDRTVTRGKPAGMARVHPRHLLFALGMLVVIAGSYLVLGTSSEAPSDTGSPGLLEQYLSRAQSALLADRLTSPEGDNAYFYYQQALALEPESEQALDGIRRIADRYADMAEALLEQSDHANAELHVANGLNVQPGNPRLRALQEKMASQIDAQIENYLLQAKVAIESNRLTVPADDNAYSYYQKVLDLDPDHEEDLHGVGKIADRYADMAESKIDNYAYSEAKIYVRKGLMVQPDHQRLLALQERTNAAKDVPGRIIRSIKSIFD